MIKTKNVTITLTPEIIEKAKNQSKEKLGNDKLSTWIAYLITNYEVK